MDEDYVMIKIPPPRRGSTAPGSVPWSVGQRRTQALRQPKGSFFLGPKRTLRIPWAIAKADQEYTSAEDAIRNHYIWYDRRRLASQPAGRRDQKRLGQVGTEPAEPAHGDRRSVGGTDH